MTSGAGDGRQGVEHRLTPGRHLLVFGAGQVAQLLSADRVERAEHHDLAMHPAFDDPFGSGSQRQGALAGPGPATQGHDADVGVEQGVECDALFRAAAMQPERFEVARTWRMCLSAVARPRRCPFAQQHHAGVGQELGIGRRGQRSAFVQRVDVVTGHLEFGDPGPAGGDDQFGAVLLGVDAHHRRLDPHRQVLGDQHDRSSLFPEVEGHGQDAGVVVTEPESGRQDLGIGVVQLDMERAARVADRGSADRGGRSRSAGRPAAAAPAGRSTPVPDESVSPRAR